MNITKQTFININKYIVLIAMILFFTGILTTIDYLQPGIIFILGAGFFCLLNQPYFRARLKQAAIVWMFPLFMTIITYHVPLTNRAENIFPIYVLTLILSLVPAIIFLFGSSEENPPKKERLPVVTVRIIIQIASFMAWAAVTAFAYIKGSRVFEGYWAFFHVTSAGIFPFIFGRVLCSWMCPNATWQDAILKNMDYRRPIAKLPKAIDEQSHSCSMNLSGRVDKNAPLLPATLLIAWFILFQIETIFDLSIVIWWPTIAYMMGLFIASMLLPWRKVCTHFCWLSGYRTLASHDSFWRIKFNKSKCRNCKKCAAEEACPFYIDICNQEYEMPASCCLCFSCMEACPYEGVITFKMDPGEKARLKNSLIKKAG